MNIKVIKKVNKPKYTLLVHYCRKWAWPKIAEFIARIDLTDLVLKETELVIFWDGITNAENLKHYFAMYDYLKEMADILNLNGVRLIITEREPLKDGARIKERRARIEDNFNIMKTRIADTKFLMMIEDDTIPERFDTFQVLLKMAKQKGVGFASAIEAGRHHKYAGAWHIEPLENPELCETLPYQETGISEVQGGGAYCFVTRTKFFKEAFFRSTEECLGLDVNFVLDLVKQGYKALVNWDLKCDHITENGKTIKVDKEIKTYRWRRVNGELKLTY